MSATRNHKRAFGLRQFRRLMRNQSGAAAIVMALSFPVVIAFFGFGGETGYWYLREAQVQGFADASAFAGANEMIAGKSDADILARVEGEAIRNGLNATRGAAVMNNPPTSGVYAGDVDAVEVVVDERQPRLFTRVFLDGDVLIRARSVARVNEWFGACVLSLAPTASDAIRVAGSSVATMDGCAMMTNSISPTAFVSTGASDLTLSCAISAGGVDLSGSVTQTDCNDAIASAPIAPDPYADLVPPPIPVVCTVPPNMTPMTSVTLTPGRYCGGLALKGDVVLDPGIYVIDGGTLAASSNANVVGDGIMFYITNGADVTINGQAHLELRASTNFADPYRGILFYGDPLNVGQVFTVAGDSTTVFEGVIYAPTQDVVLAGTGDVGSDCFLVVAQTVEITGDAQLSSTCDMFNLAAPVVSGIVRIVE